MGDDPLDTFVAQARAYSEFVQRASALLLPERLTSARLRLLELYKAALSLPASPEPGTTEAGPSPEAPDNWRGFDENDCYWEVFDPYEEDAPVAGSLSDDLLDVYRDIQRGLALWDASHHREALWEWRFHFDVHWGDHAVDALRALHRACKERG
ncbi:MAG TPA: DUF5063 domain-containing protein [Kofleriaceae bacterium]|nr:DUF5063 domain-containing protein [Kofleriaceae bacterium]